MNSVYCLFLNESDGYTYSCETLIGVFESEEDANISLKYHIEKMTRIEAAYKEYGDRSSEIYESIKQLLRNRVTGSSYKNKRKNRKNNDAESNADDLIQEKYYEELQRLRNELEQSTSGVTRMSSSLEDYCIRKMVIGEIESSC